MYSNKIVNRFWSRVIKNTPDKCWEWTGTKTKAGYGCIWIGPRKTGNNRRAHRVSWEIAHNQKIPNDLYILHHCDNPLCVNPNHLFLGTQKDNSDDMRSKGRAVYPHDETHPFAKLNWAKVKEIRYKSSNGISQKELAKEYDVNKTTIWQVIHRKCWRD